MLVKLAQIDFPMRDTWEIMMHTKVNESQMEELQAITVIKFHTNLQHLLLTIVLVTREISQLLLE